MKSTSCALTPGKVGVSKMSFDIRILTSSLLTFLFLGCIRRLGRRGMVWLRFAPVAYNSTTEPGGKLKQREQKPHHTTLLHDWSTRLTYPVHQHETNISLQHEGKPDPPSFSIVHPLHPSLSRRGVGTAL